MNKVTVIIPAYGVEKYIASTIESVLAQSYQNFELVIVDDGSPDRSVEICQRFKDPRIRILRQENQGPAAARNLGIANSSGEYIAFLDGDDLWQPDKLAKHVEHLNNAPEVGVSFCRSELIDEFDRSLGMYQVITKLEDITPLDLLCRTPIGNGSVPVIRRSTLEDIKYTLNQGETEQTCFFNPDRSIHPSEDVECWMRIALTTSWKIAGISDALTLYRVNSRGFSANLEKKLASWERMLEAVEQYAPDACQKWMRPAMAYQLRHLARRAVSLRDGQMAISFSHRAMSAYSPILTEEPYRTFQTFAAAYSVRFFPIELYKKLEKFMMQKNGIVQSYVAKTSE
ncbi:glycosyltransferase family A protein [Leptolyngbya sp. FACHB-711]|uniref:glycosyltransferase family 2 protein n=1 Tax=unclassified Leptolyngbya TaxID=2650499 RepID=UPI0016830C16|nr:glycosyltransferase family A protein [Leptolyngbya sp. FACHB-711]MBD1851951.1 glycosyltransferase family 2 protein [Cyanobacteria bacterium FACHB-502]MBD2027766.1 glycosyltransferase family 2 protein [Leptolyngbya sp. FACHB-711]